VGGVSLVAGRGELCRANQIRCAGNLTSCYYQGIRPNKKSAVFLSDRIYSLLQNMLKILKQPL